MSHRPELHVTAEEGILAAPAGVLLHDDVWHVFNQYKPSASASSRWGHQASRALPYDWEVCDDVLATHGDEVELRAGSVIPVGKGIDIFFTAVSADATTIKVAEIADADATTETVADDISHLDRHVANVHTVVSDCHGYSHFRSPCVVPDWRSTQRDDHHGWIMLAVAGSSDNPDIVVFESADRRDWNFVGPLRCVGTPSGVSHYKRIVSPRLIRLQDEVDEKIYDVLLLTVETDGRDISGYLVGTLTDSEFSVITPFTRLDRGHDFSRPRNTNVVTGFNTDPAARYASSTMFGLMNGVGRGDDPTTHLSLQQENWANCLTLPRRVTLQGGILYQTPRAGLPDAIRASEHARAFIARLDAQPSEDAVVDIELRDATGAVGARVSYSSDEISLDRSMNPHHEGSAPAVAERSSEETEALSLIVDGSTVEVFADGGLIAMASRVYFDGGCQSITYTARHGARVESTMEIEPL
ncbi:GH32 C-terminal domain-containing protein [Corynebacterium sp. 11A]|uniref:GH32 C-terminal domain-containing protein n=1 Tax=Corynebacterium sp. 11A TaxID=2080510 RepID=UPI00124F59CF|nr:GH32 C-terminal domain-containing protein [Corynebacterium sp. 11A]